MVDLIRSSCSVLIQREERFTKTAVGWILRELSKIYKKEVVSCIEEYIDFFFKREFKKCNE